ncbi:hypothetical protein EKD00_04795 [Chlorobium phaeovibrioides]|uniref:DUF883 domain-containing protein n=1 Tax=Chlorobium phaeovibrioides TaxID=1094 RepID=A0A5M8ICJ1_CHLPH|nr:hypothetical protein [Chlorobium phaeovibrioides]KAA6233103.1 hypothetical protein FP507_08675 [Chlorobium phaeovibrioides]RTY35787.1 hypothetical protein EKD00_04795 [Chlorobium phaeovibrioides]
MEQEVPVIHSAAKDSAEKQFNPAGDGRIPEQIREISDSLSDAFARFRQSDSYDSMIDIAEQSRTYIRKKPLQAMLYSLGAGALLGMMFGKKS